MRWILAVVALVTLDAPAASAQGIGFRGFGDVGGTRFTAGQSFDAVLGSHSGFEFGGGVETVLPPGIFVNLRASRFQKDGSRVFVLNDQVFDLGIPTTVRVTPVQVTGGYRFKVGRRHIVPYVGGGVGWFRYSETSDFADASEDVSDTFTGYHLLGGAEWRMSRIIGVAGEAEWSTVPDALGQNPSGASAAFNETDLGGVTFRVKVVVGR
ncbi:MAG TPA: outer membrane beta-barrel protein [Vicinamibacterales bacterium]|jgi:opacity protein-like surface antigen